jgi:hypothetical protein
VDFGNSRLYEFELWSQTGYRIADISALCQNREYTLQRNEAETIRFDIDVVAFEAYCLNNLAGTDPKSLLSSYVTDVKVKRAGNYILGAQVVDISFSQSRDTATAGTASSGNQSALIATVTCTGYLNFFKDRYVTAAYLATERTTIASNITMLTQSQTNGSVGVTIGGSPYATGQLSDRTYQLDNVKLKLQELATLSDSPFDFAFTPQKVFQTYSKIGARRSDITLVYGGPLGNVSAFSLDRSAINLYNKIYGLGSGFGASQLTSTQSDTTSQLNFYVREWIDQFNSVILQPTLDQNTIAALSVSKDILALPVVTITGKEIPINRATGVQNFINIGDRIPLKVVGHTMLNDINALYRVEKIEVTLDDNDFERDIRLTLDTYLVNQSE